MTAPSLRRVVSSPRLRHALGLALAAAIASSATPAAAAPVDPAPAATPTAAEACPHDVRFRNDTGAALELHLGADAPLPLARGGLVSWCARTDTLDWTVQATGWRYGGQLDLRGLQRRDVVLTAPGGTAAVVNRSGEPQEITLNGVAYGTLVDGAARRLGPLPAGTYRLAARGERSRAWQAQVLEVPVAGLAQIELVAPATLAAVINPADEAVALRLDGVDYGPLAARATLWLSGLLPGPHEAQLVGQQSGRVWRFEVVARQDGGAEAARPAEIALHLRNQTGEALALPAALFRFGDVLAAGADTTWRVPRATFGITLEGVDSGLAYHLDVLAKGPDAVEWTLERPRATLRLRNDAGEPVVVAVGAQARLHLAATTRAAVDVPAGRLALRAETADGDRRLATGLFLQPGSDATWHMQAEATTLALHSGHAEPLRARVDGFERGQIPPEGRLRLDVEPGEHRVEVAGTWSAARAGATLPVRDGDRARVQLDPHGGTLHLDNRQGVQRLLVLVRGVQAAVAEPGAELAIPVTPGRLVAEVRDAETNRSAVWQGRVTPTQQIELPLPGEVLGAIDVAVQGTRALDLALDDGPVQRVAAGGQARFDGVRPGDHLLTVTVADGPEGASAVRRRVRIDADRPLARVVIR